MPSRGAQPPPLLSLRYCLAASEVVNLEDCGQTRIFARARELLPGRTTANHIQSLSAFNETVSRPKALHGLAGNEYYTLKNTVRGGWDPRPLMSLHANPQAS